MEREVFEYIYMNFVKDRLSKVTSISSTRPTSSTNQIELEGLETDLIYLKPEVIWCPDGKAILLNILFYLARITFRSILLKEKGEAPDDCDKKTDAFLKKGYFDYFYTRV